MRCLLRRVGYGESLGEHAAEVSEQLFLLTDRQILPPRFGRRKWGQARGGVRTGWSDMGWLLQRCERGTRGTSVPVRARPTGRRSLEVLYHPRQRLRREEAVVGSVFSVAKKLSTGALSQHWATRLMLHTIPCRPSRS